jgi:hypothetical protein
MMPGNGRGRPLEQGAASNTTSPATGFALDYKAVGLVHVDPLDEIAHHVDGTFVLVVKVTGGKYRRRCLLTAAAAEKAARNAIEAGHNAEVYLAELMKPLWKLSAPTPPDLFGDVDGSWSE